MNAPTNSNIALIVKVDERTGERCQYRACSACKRFDVPHHDPKKTCERCRAKSRKSYASSHEKMLARLKTTVDQYSLETSPLIQSESSGPPLKPLKRKAEKAPEELEGEEQRRAAKTMKSSPDVKAKKPEHHTKPKVISFIEYQRASLLYDAVGIASSSSPLCNFTGSHSIIRCDNIDHNKRVKMVTKDLRKIVKIPFKHDLPIKKIVRDTKVRVKYNCTCESSTPKTLTALTNPSGRKTVGPGGATAVRANRNSNTPDTSCGGSVIITVRNDDSHFLGIPGQKVVVEIVH